MILLWTSYRWYWAARGECEAPFAPQYPAPAAVGLEGLAGLGPVALNFNLAFVGFSYSETSCLGTVLRAPTVRVCGSPPRCVTGQQ